MGGIGISGCAVFFTATGVNNKTCVCLYTFAAMLIHKFLIMQLNYKSI